MNNTNMKMTSLSLSENLNITHKTVTNIITRFTDDFLTFGPIESYKMQPGEKGGRPKHVYIFNEQQKSLAMMYLGNTINNRKFKIDMVKKINTKNM